jgi:hypothetical protein
MSHPKDAHFMGIVVDLVDDSVLSNPNPALSAWRERRISCIRGVLVEEIVEPTKLDGFLAHFFESFQVLEILDELEQLTILVDVEDHRYRLAVADNDFWR